MRFPGFKILDRYILGKFLSTYFFANAMIIVIVVIFDYAEKVDDFTASNAPFDAIIFDYYLNFVPSFVNQFSGLFAFIAVIFFTSKLAYQTEIIAMLSGGMSFKRLMWPYFLGAFMIAGLSLVLNLWVIPISQRTYVEFDATYIDQVTSGDFDRHIYRQVDPGVFVYIRGYTLAGKASFFALDRYRDGDLIESLEAGSVQVDSLTGRWQAPRYITRKFNGYEGDGEAGQIGEVFTQHRNLDTLINLDIVELSRIEELLLTMKIGELNDFLEQQKEKGSDSITAIEVAWHTRFAYPFGTFILTLIGVSLSSRKVRGGTGLHIGIGVALCFSYVLFNRFAEEFAKGGAVSTEIAVWSPNILYLLIGIYCYYKAPK
ncbi:MAG: LptF/LptG family permease [Rikenellaceae bacterium]